MTEFKVEVEENYLSWENSCFICVQPLDSIEKQSSSLNLLFNYLKISVETQETFACKKCARNIAKFEKLSNYLKKVRLEMDYLLELIQSTIVSSEKEFKLASLGLSSVRESVANKCKAHIWNPMPEILLQRVDISNIITRDITDNPENSSPTLNDENEDASIPMISEVRHVKKQLDLEEETTSVGVNSEALLEPANKVDDRVTKGMTPLKIRLTRGNKRLWKMVRKGRKKADKEKGKKGSGSKGGKKLHACSYCPKKFVHKCHLEIHLRTHTNERPFVCPQCSSDFKTKDHLRRHMVSHTGQRPYQCTLCGRDFKLLETLNQHAMTHTGVKRFHCKCCSFKTRRKADLQRHHNTRHKHVPFQL